MIKFLLGGVLLCWLPFAALAEEAQSVAVQTVPLATHSLAHSLTAYGVLEADPDQVISLSLPHAGLIERVQVRLGQKVASGDPLVSIATAPQARMQYLQAKSAVDFARREFKRQQQLFSEQLATQAQLDAARRDLADAKASFDAMKNRGQGLAREILRAPMDGIVTAMNVSQGQRVAAETNALLLAAQDKVIARLGIEPEDVASIQAGMPVLVKPVFAPQLAISSKVRDVHAMVDPTTHLVEVLVAIPDPERHPLALGTRVVATLTLAEHDALAVPPSAVLKDDKGSYLFRVEGGKAKRVAVTTGLESRDYVEVAGDLAAGQPIVVSGNYELSDGMAIREAKP
ncbi:efflux RND transporter periplasmic adaptor subunit [Gallaecimonas kandeliae]|uniref:efflux RND transporter periplasmic adaptor subunit n=1 Tax=Gallaecimonas kandeliae TaxID=3029055 RepID=UPI002648D265|nr:efflux RND transporter periplasmic adaptor subunit [Gallaecimonas kandeliae]WKE66614.1 efflux RND transporter periplasmic adaptor subunit [Gallaecimonas kandeliae]